MPIMGYDYEVFISYRHQEPDRQWVRKTLEPALTAQGLRVCIDYRDFRPGFLLLKQIERAVEQSYYTLAILSPRYLQSNFAELENVMAEHLGLERSERRLITVTREACKPRLSMRAHLQLDMTRDDEFDSNLIILANELRRPPDL